MQRSFNRHGHRSAFSAAVMVICTLSGVARAVLKDNGMYDDIVKSIWEKGTALAEKANPRVPELISELRCAWREIHA